MRKEEKINEIKKRAYEYAESGDYDDCLSIEHKLTSERFSLAEEALGDPFIHGQLDSLCSVATSLEEVERRNRFESWLDETRSIVSPAVKEKAPEVLLFINDSTLFVKGPTYSFEIRRRFGSNELEVTKTWEEKDGQRLRTQTPNIINDSNFEEITGERAVELIMGFVRSTAATQ